MTEIQLNNQNLMEIIANKITKRSLNYKYLSQMVKRWYDSASDSVKNSSPSRFFSKRKTCTSSTLEIKLNCETNKFMFLSTSSVLACLKIDNLW